MRNFWLFKKRFDCNKEIISTQIYPLLSKLYSAWITVDPLHPDFEKFPEYQNAHPLKLRLNSGDVLYLPSLWFHHLKQSQGCVAVNFWYDMEFDCKFNYFSFMKSLHSLLKE